LIVLMGFTTWYQQKQMQSQNTGGGAQAQQMQLMGRIMPAFLMFIAYSFPTGVVIYWLTTNVWTIGQQRLMLRVAPAVGKASGNGSGGKGATGELAYGNGNPPPQAPSKPHPSSKKKRKKR
jgi:membrane protein insertase Oxa1/YidC/SpoIIIJ